MGGSQNLQHTMTPPLQRFYNNSTSSQGTYRQITTQEATHTTKYITNGKRQRTEDSAETQHQLAGPAQQASQQP
jgi:hypothetical protein